jgi:hypothetical protein
MDEAEYFLDCVQCDFRVASGNSSDALKVMRLIDSVYQNEWHNRPDLYDRLHS